MDKKDRVIAWWSGGITSAVACLYALNDYDNVELIYIETGQHHPDHLRFKNDCEKWYGVKIETVQSEKYNDVFDVMYKKRYINGVAGAPCTKALKKDVRYKVEEDGFKSQVFGFEFSKHEINRAKRFKEQYPHTNPLYPLIDHELTKANCMYIVKNQRIRIPAMYELGYNNSNCIGCVKGGMGYWNKIRVDFPDYFNKMIEVEDDIGASALKIPLRELDPKAGNMNDEIMPECGLFCDLEFVDLISKKK